MRYLPLWLFFFTTSVNAHAPANLLNKIRFDQHLNGRLPLDAAFVDESGKSVKLGAYFVKSPVILLFGYYTCKNLCSPVQESLIRTMNEISLKSGSDYQVVSISIDPLNSSMDARHRMERLGALFAGSNSGKDWHLLTGREENIKRVADAAGFRYAYNPKEKEFLHASGIVIVTSDGIISKYIFGAGFRSRDVRLGLVDASHGVIGNAVDQLLLRCFHFDPATGKYSLMIITLLRWMGVLTVFGIVTTISFYIIRERKISFNKSEGKSGKENNRYAG